MNRAAQAESSRETASRKGLPAISACVITLNEEANVRRCLESISFVDEIILVDSGSTDRTREIAAKMGAEVHRRRFDGFVNQKNYAISLARGRWVLVVDADEIVTSGLRAEIEDIVRENRGNCIAYRIPRMTHYLGRWIKHSGWYPDYNIRLFVKGRGRFEGGTVHERVVTSGAIGTLRHHLEHHSYRNVSDHLARMDHYSTLIAEDKFQHGKRSGILWALVKSVSKFLLTYIWRFGFLDGRAGLVIAVLGGYYNFLKYLKLYELRKGLRKVSDVRTWQREDIDVEEHTDVRPRPET